MFDLIDGISPTGFSYVGVIGGFGTGELGNAFEPKQMPTESRAIQEVERLSGHHVGVIAFSRTADPDLGEYGEAIVLAQCGEIPDLD